MQQQQQHHEIKTQQQRVKEVEKAHNIVQRRNISFNKPEICMCNVIYVKWAQCGAVVRAIEHRVDLMQTDSNFLLFVEKRRIESNRAKTKNMRNCDNKL